MSEPSPEEPSLVAFPSDAITLGQMRRHEPELFTLGAISKRSDCDAFATHWWERVLAENAVANAEGRQLPHPDVDREHVVTELLHEAYADYGLSRGIHETRRIVEQFEKDAVGKAKSQHGR